MEQLLAVKIEDAGDNKVVTGWVRRGGRRQRAWTLTVPASQASELPDMVDEIEKARAAGKNHPALRFQRTED